MSNIGHALEILPPMIGSGITVFSASTSTGIDIPSALGAAAVGMGGYIDVILYGSDGFVGWGGTGKTVTSGGASAGVYLPLGQPRTWIIPPSGATCLYVSGVGGATTWAYVYKSSATSPVQFADYLNGRKNAL